MLSAKESDDTGALQGAPGATENAPVSARPIINRNNRRRSGSQRQTVGAYQC